MSIKYMAYGYEWKFDRPAEREVYMALADHADGEGRNIRPSVALVAWKIEIDERTVRRWIANLLKKGILVKDVDGKPIGKPNVYHIDAAKGIPKEAFRPERVGQNALPQPDGSGKIPYQGRTQLCPTGSDTAMPYDPSLNPSTEPSDSKTNNSPGGLLIDAMFDGMPPEVCPAIRTYSEANLTVARVLSEKGFTPERVAAYVKYAYEKDAWLKKGTDGLPIKIWMGRIAEKIAAYEAMRPPTISPYEAPDDCEGCGRSLSMCTCGACKDCNHLAEFCVCARRTTLTPPILDRWRAVFQQTAAQLGKVTTERWLKHLKPLEIRPDALVLEVPDIYTKDWLDRHLLPAMTSTLHLLWQDDPLTRDLTLLTEVCA